jgi:hypothetical protein
MNILTKLERRLSDALLLILVAGIVQFAMG